MRTWGRGEAGDLISNSLGYVPNRTQERAALQFFNEDFTINQTVTATVVTYTGMSATVTQQRTLTNMVRGAPSLAGGAIRGYTFTMSQPKIQVP